MIDVKSLLVRMGADISGMDRGFKKADSLIQKNKEKFKKAGKAIAVAGAAIVGTIGLMVKSYVKAGDEVHKMALRTGLSTEALSELKYAAEISGTSLATVEKGVKKMASSIGEAKLGLKTYTDAFALINMKVEEMEGLKPEEQFMKMAAGIASIVDPTQRAYAAQKLLGRAGTELLPLFAEGADGMENLRQKARDLGLSISGPAAKGAADLNDALTDLKGSFKGVSMAIAEQLAPTIEGIVDKITNVAMRVKDWIKENPILAGVLMKVVGVLGILAMVLGPILILLPALSTGFIMLWGAITGPVGIVIAAVAAVAAAAMLIYKNWEPIKKFFINLWESVTGFFSNAFNTIKKTLLDWAISITGILEKIPIVKKLAGPWKESLERMKADMDEAAYHAAGMAKDIEKASAAAGKAWVEAIKGTTLFKDASAAAKEETGLLGKGLAVLKVGLKAISEGFGTTGKSAENTVTRIAKSNDKITAMVKTMADEIKKATLDEYEYAKWAAEQKYLDRKKAIEGQVAEEMAGAEELKALEKQKVKALAVLNKNYHRELETLDKGYKKKEKTRQDELLSNLKEGRMAYQEFMKGQLEAYEAAKQGITDRINQITMSELEYTIWAMDQEFERRKEAIEREIRDEEQKAEILGLLNVEYAEGKKKILSDAADAIKKKEEEAAKAARDAWKRSLENTLADVGMILNQIGSLFQQSYDLKMALIDQEEDRRIEAINNQYNLQIDALRGISEAERAKTQEVLSIINQEYDKKKQHILDNVKNEEKRAQMLADLEKEREAALEQARTERAQAEEDAAQAVIDLENEKNEALRLASEDLESKRRAARRTAAKQEKAVALLSAIVNTAAAIAKALPNIPLAIAVGILGAIQIAIIAAYPLPPLKEGGIVMKPTAALIGEAGPEAVIPLSKLRPTLEEVEKQSIHVFIKPLLIPRGDRYIVDFVIEEIKHGRKIPIEAVGG